MMAAEAAKTLLKTYLSCQKTGKRHSWELESMGAIPVSRELEKDPLTLCVTGTRPGLTSELHMNKQTQSNITKTLKTKLTLELQPGRTFNLNLTRLVTYSKTTKSAFYRGF